MNIKAYYTTLTLGLLLLPALSHASECITDITLLKGKEESAFRSDEGGMLVGYWDVDKGGAFDSNNKNLGEYWVSLSTMKSPMSTESCIEDIRLEHRDWNKSNIHPRGYTFVGAWDVDAGGSKDTIGGGGPHRMHLYYKRMSKNSKPKTVITDINMFISNNLPNPSALPNILRQNFKQIGWWDVDTSGGCGYTEYSKNCGSYAAELFSRPAPFNNGVKINHFGGQWHMIQSCRGKQGCKELSANYTVGVEKGKAFEESSSIGKALSVTVGAEATVFGVGVSTEVSGSLSSDYTSSIMKSFSQSASKSITITCDGASELWQWKSVVNYNRGNEEEIVEAASDIVACAPAGKGPRGTDLKNAAWEPNH